MVIMSERKLAEWKKSKEVFSFAVVTCLERLVTFICSHGLFVKKKQSLFWQISRVEDKRKKQQGDKGRGERERKRKRKTKKERKRRRRHGENTKGSGLQRPHVRSRAKRPTRRMLRRAKRLRSISWSRRKGHLCQESQFL